MGNRNKNVWFFWGLLGGKSRWRLAEIEGDQLIFFLGGSGKRDGFQPTTPEYPGGDGCMNHQCRNQRGRDGVRLMFLVGGHVVRFW